MKITIKKGVSMATIIAALDSKRVIGNKGKMPWHIPEELAFFKNMTLNKCVIMGRKTFESIGSKALPDRFNIVLTSNPPCMGKKGVLFQKSLGDALDFARDLYAEENIFIIGGSQVYKEALPLANKLILSFIHGSFEGDTYFPEYEHLFSFEKFLEYRQTSTPFHVAQFQKIFKIPKQES